MAKRKKLTKKAVGTRKSAYQNRRRKGLLAVMLPWFKRFGLVTAAMFAVIWLGAWFFLSDADTRASNWVGNKTVMTMASLGFEVENVLIEGRVYSDPEILKAIINTQKGDPLFGFDPVEAKTSIEKIAWVESAHVERRLPNTIYIKLVERKPLALLQKDKKLSLIDVQGEVIPTNTMQPFKEMVIVMGEGAPPNAAEILYTLHAEPEIFNRIESIGFIAERRWDVIMKNAMRVKLPEHDVGLAVRRLAKAQKEDGILDKDLTGIDLRDPQRMIVRTKPGASREYQSGLTKANAKSGNNI